jgi:hypothetical protein
MRADVNPLQVVLAGVGLLALMAATPNCAAKGLRANRPDAEPRPGLRAPRDELSVTNTADSGKGSLRQAILTARAREGPHTVRFDSVTGPFAMPQTIRLESELPELVGELTIDGYIEDRLWKPTGVTVSGAGGHRVFRVAPGARVRIGSLTIANGRASRGAGIANRGELVVKGVTFVGNVAEEEGGGIANLGGTLTVVNSTFVDNRAGQAGGGLADGSGRVTVTNCTFSGNAAPRGGGLHSSGTLLLRNSILANSEGGADCVAAGALDSRSTHNLIEAHQGCGEPISSADPRLGKLGGYNGPTPTLPLGGGSPAINLGDNASALDEHGQPLRWDQRGGGDPRFVAGITDIGAFERQAFAVLVVDTLEDAALRACTRAAGDCPLRGAIALANARGEPEVITFDSKLFAGPRTLTFERPLPEVRVDLTLDARGTGGVTLRGRPLGLSTAPGARLSLHEVVLEGDR